MTKVAVAMSGGVDSSVTAARVVAKYGKENVFGVTMRLFCYGEAEADEKSCCSLDAVNDAKAVANQLGIPHYAISLEKEFEEAVIQNFIDEYKKGHTPIPCVLCNTVIKFEYLMKKVRELGADYLATGHYARTKGEVPNTSDHIPIYQLLKGVDEAKDQTYFLYGLNQEQLEHTLFPLGAMKKTEVRKEAAKLGLKTAEKKESQGICFVTEGRVTDWLSDKVKNTPGDIVNTKGEKVAEHEGIVFYTVGQRKRIGGGHAEPMYVVRVDAKKNQVVIGTKADLYSSELKFDRATWTVKAPKLPKKCTAKIRYNMEPMDCIIGIQKSNPKSQNDKSKLINSNLIRNSKLETRNYNVTFNEPQRAITPGQSVVFYDGDVVLGGGIIAS